jgi:hypothetical protein
MMVTFGTTDGKFLFLFLCANNFDEFEILLTFPGNGVFFGMRILFEKENILLLSGISG